MRVIDEHGHEVPQDEVGEIVIRADRTCCWRRPEEMATAVPDAR